MAELAEKDSHEGRDFEKQPHGKETEGTHPHTHTHSHTHGVVDPELLSTEKGLYAVRWSFAGLMLTALFQIVIVYISGSVALLSLIHISEPTRLNSTSRMPSSA